MKAYVRQLLYVTELLFKEKRTSHFRNVLFDVFCVFWFVILCTENGHLFLIVPDVMYKQKTFCVAFICIFTVEKIFEEDFYTFML
jgi:hypothetical protein